ncbi:MAG: CorA family divalent cation transporter [Myxococcota bacterium]
MNETNRSQPKSLIPSQWAVPAKFRARVGESVGRQRQMLDEGHLLLVLHEVPEPGESERRGRFFWRDKQGAWRSSSHGSGVGGLREHVAEFERAVDGLEERLRSAKAAKDFFAVLQAATPLHRTSRNLTRTLQEAREAVDDRELINLRDRANEVERGAELCVSEARDGLEFTSAQNAEQQAALSLELARDSHKLNVITAVFLPITALASIFSMTLHSGLEGVGEPWVFWLIVAAGIALGTAMRRNLTPR